MTQPVPAGQVDARLRPGERPRDGPQRVDRRGLVASPARRRSRPEAQVGQLADRGDVAEERGETRVVVDQRPVGGPRRSRPARRRSAPPTARARSRRASCSGVGRLEDRAGHLLEVAAGDRRVGVVGGDDLALLGQLEPGVDRARRLAEDRPVGRTAAPPERAAAAVEQRQRRRRAPWRPRPARLRLVEHPGGREEARFLVRVGVAEHHLLAVAARGQAVAVRRVVEQRAEDRAGLLRAARSTRTAGPGRGPAAGAPRRRRRSSRGRDGRARARR